MRQSAVLLEKGETTCHFLPTLTSPHTFLLVTCTAYIETMKALGYPRPISLNNFRNPNFELVADCLQWLIHRLVVHHNI